MKKKTNKGVIKKLWKYAYKYRFAFVLSLITAALYVAGALYLPKLYGEMTNLIVGKEICSEKFRSCRSNISTADLRATYCPSK